MVRMGFLVILIFILAGCGVSRTIYFEGRGLREGQNLTIQVQPTQEQTTRLCDVLIAKPGRACLNGNQIAVTDGAFWHLLHEIGHWMGYTEAELGGMGLGAKDIP